METLTGPLADALARHRQELNARFAARQQAGALDAASFLEHLAVTVDPIVRAVGLVLPERTDVVVMALYDLSLDLFVMKWLGPEMKDTAVRDAWQTVLPQAPLLVAREPERLAGSISNAVINLVSTPGAKTHEWLSRLAAVAPRCTSATALLQCGKVLAWQAGMAQFREGALNTASQLEAPLAAATLGLPADLAGDKLATAIDRLRGDPWLTPAESISPDNSPRKLCIVRQAGGFRGFGGPFLRPPKVNLAAADFIVDDGEKSWRLIADAFGAVFVRVEPQQSPQSNTAVAVEKSGSVRWNGETADFPELRGVDSSACDGRTLAVTLPTSHFVFLLAKAK